MHEKCTYRKKNARIKTLMFLSFLLVFIRQFLNIQFQTHREKLVDVPLSRVKSNRWNHNCFLKNVKNVNDAIVL